MFSDNTEEEIEIGKNLNKCILEEINNINKQQND